MSERVSEITVWVRLLAVRDDEGEWQRSKMDTWDNDLDDLTHGRMPSRDYADQVLCDFDFQELVDELKVPTEWWAFQSVFEVKIFDTQSYCWDYACYEYDCEYEITQSAIQQIPSKEMLELFSPDELAGILNEELNSPYVPFTDPAAQSQSA